MIKSNYLEHKKDSMGENSFMKKILKKRLNQKGLTLIELLAVIVILAIVAAIAIPAIGSLISNSRVGAIKGDALNALSSANIYFTENSSATSVEVSALISGGYMESGGSLTTTTAVTKVATGSDTISGQGTTGGVTVVFNAATTANIDGFANNSAVNATTTVPVRVSAR